MSERAGRKKSGGRPAAPPRRVGGGRLRGMFGVDEYGAVESKMAFMRATVKFRRLPVVAITCAVLVALPAVAGARSTEEAKCLKRRLNLFTTGIRNQVSCHGKAALRDAPVDETCLDRAGERLVASWAKNDRKSACADESPAILIDLEHRVDEAVNGFMGDASVGLTLGTAPTTFLPVDLRVVSSNIWKSGRAGYNLNTNVPLGDPLTSLSGIGRYLASAVAAGGGLPSWIGLQEVYDTTVPGGAVSVGDYLAGQIAAGWSSTFQPLHSPEAGGTFGNAVLTNLSVSKTEFWEFAHDPGNSEEYGREQRGAIANKVLVAGEQLWLIDVHLDPPNAIATRQMWQLMGLIKRLDPSVPVVVVGDFNMAARYGSESGHELGYRNLASVFDAPNSGFESVCVGLPTAIPGINGDGDAAPANSVAGLALTNQIDFAFVYDPNDLLRTRCRADFVAEDPLIFADHKALVVDIAFE